MAVNPPPADLTEAMVINQGTASLVIRMEGNAIKARVIGTASYGPDGRNASASIDLPDSAISSALAESLSELQARYEPAARTQAFLAAADALGVAQRGGEYR